MVRKLFALAIGMVVMALAAGVNAEDKPKEAKPEKLEGKLVCTKCELKETKACGHALIVKKGDKELKYYIKDKGGKESYHGAVCSEPKDATVTGKIVEKKEKDVTKLYIEGAKVEIK